jgi:phospholipase C
MSWSRQSWGPEQPRIVVDLTGDGAGDIVGFGLDGVWASLNNGNGTFEPPNIVLSAFSFHTGWIVERHPRFLADLTGDGRADIAGFGDAGVWTSLNNGDGTFQPMKFVVADLGYNHGWRVDQHPRLVTDLTGDGKADILGFGNDGVWVCLGNGDGTFRPPKFVLNDLGYNQGWRVGQHPRYVVDITGEGKADIVGFGNDGIWVALGNGDGTFQPAKFVLAGFNPGQGWQGAKHPRIMGDLNGDRRADIIGFGDAGVYASNSSGDGTFAPGVFILSEMGYDNGWRIENHSRFATDVTGDGKADLIGFGDDGVWVSVTGGSGAKLVLAEFCFNKGWRVPYHPLFLADLNGDRKADIIGFGDAGVWVALSNGDGTFQPATFVLADFGYHAGPVVQSITIEFHTHNDDLNSDALLHIFIKNRASDSSSSGGATNFEANIESYRAHDADWYGKNPYLGYAVNASNGNSFGDQSTNTVTLQLRSQPIPVEELQLPEVHFHILADSSDTWKFDYTLTITLDNGTVLPAFNSNVNGLVGIVLNQDNRNYYGICAEIEPVPARAKPATNEWLTGVMIEFKTHDDDKNSDTKLSIHIVDRISATESQDISVATDVAKGETFADSTDDGGNPYKRIDLPLASRFIYLRDMILPVVYINIGAGEDQWIFDYRVTLFFGGQPYSWTVSGVVLDQDNHKHMGVYSGRPFPTLFYPMAPIMQDGQARTPTKDVSLAFVARKLDELFNSRQAAGAANPLLRVKLFSSNDFGDQNPPSYSDLQSIANDPPAPDGQPLDPKYVMGTKYSHSISELGWFTTVFGLGVHLNDINTESIAITINPDDGQTPITVDVKFETGGPPEVTGSFDLNLVNLQITLRLTLRYLAATKAVDLFGWVDDINGFTYTPIPPIGPPRNPPAPIVYKVSGTFLGQPIDQITIDPSRFKTDLVEKVVKVQFNTGSTFDPGAHIRWAIRDKIFSTLSNTNSDLWSRVTTRDSINAQATSFLIGHVIASGNSELVPYPYPSELTNAVVQNGALSLAFNYPQMRFRNEAPPDWPASIPPGTLANIDHIIVLLQENRSFDHMLGYLSLPYEKGGMARHDVDGLKGNEFNLYSGRKCVSFRLAAGDTIFSPGPPNGPERVATQINGGKMNGFVQAQAEECGPATAHRVMGYHTADNVPTYDSLARDFAVGHRWFASHPGPTFPNRFYELSGRLNIDSWGAWEYSNSSPLVASISETIFDHLTDSKVSWRCFEHGYSFIRRFERYTFDSEHVVSYDDRAVGFKALAMSGELPSVSFIEPHYVDYPPNSFCDEPPSDIRNSQRFIRDLVETVVASPKWDKTLLLITYDEHGGFYDHVPPPNAVPVAPGMLQTTGVRVPCFVISPWVKSGAVFGSDALHFDHTSILKTIARRFMSKGPPYMGARYAAAHDLSEILEIQIRPGPFRPFIPYALVCGASKMFLDVRNASLAAGAPLWQSSPNRTDAHSFRFEDAGNGFVYMRTLARLYVTVNVRSGIHTSLGGALGITQDRKYAPGSVGPHNPDLQRWKFASSTVTAIHPNDYTISCAAVPGMVLQPAGGSTASGAAVVLAVPEHVDTIVMIPNAWNVTSPLLPPRGVVIAH